MKSVKLYKVFSRQHQTWIAIKKGVGEIFQKAVLLSKCFIYWTAGFQYHKTRSQLWNQHFPTIPPPFSPTSYPSLSPLAIFLFFILFMLSTLTKPILKISVAVGHSPPSACVPLLAMPVFPTHYTSINSAQPSCSAIFKIVKLLISAGSKYLISVTSLCWHVCKY